MAMKKSAKRRVEVEVPTVERLRREDIEYVSVNVGRLRDEVSTLRQRQEQDWVRFDRIEKALCDLLALAGAHHGGETLEARLRTPVLHAIDGLNERMAAVLALARKTSTGRTKKATTLETIEGRLDNLVAVLARK